MEQGWLQRGLGTLRQMIVPPQNSFKTIEPSSRMVSMQKRMSQENPLTPFATHGMNMAFPGIGNIFAPIANRALNEFTVQDEFAASLGERVTDAVSPYVPAPIAGAIGAGAYTAANVFDGVPGPSLAAIPGSKRLMKARDQGYMIDMPLYHGTNRDIERFDLSKGGLTTNSPVGTLGVSLSLDPETANEFALLASRKNQGGIEGANVIQAFHRAERPAAIDLDGTETNEEIYATVLDAWEKGFDALMFRNYITPKGNKGRSFVLVRDPSQVRSVNAQFDPSKRDSSSLLAGLSALGFTAMLMDDDDKPGQAGD